MPVETCPQPLLVEEVGNQTDASAKHKETVENTHLKVVLCLLGSESATVADEIDEADGDAAIHVQDEVILLGGRDRLDRKRVIEELGAREVLLNVLLDKLDTKIGVVARFDSVADTGD